MANFQTTTIIVAFVLFIICLLFVWFMISKKSNEMTWPPLVGDCPDYWVDTSGNGGNCVNTKGLGTCTASGSSMNFSIAPYTGSNGICNKYKWASKCDITWDGITSGVPNPCDASFNSSS